MTVDESYYVYAHYTDKGCFYIGKGKDNRCYSTSDRNEDWWKHALVDNIISFEVEFLKNGMCEEDAYIFEKKCLDEYGLESLANKQNGHRDKNLDEYINYKKNLIL